MTEASEHDLGSDSGWLGHLAKQTQVCYVAPHQRYVGEKPHPGGGKGGIAVMTLVARRQAS
jgi:hypothetical protein